MSVKKGLIFCLLSLWGDLESWTYFFGFSCEIRLKSGYYFSSLRRFEKGGSLVFIPFDDLRRGYFLPAPCKGLKRAAYFLMLILWDNLKGGFYLRPCGASEKRAYPFVYAISHTDFYHMVVAPVDGLKSRADPSFFPFELI